MIPSHVAPLLPDDGRGGLGIDVTAIFVAPDDDVVAHTGSHADRGAAAAADRGARAARALAHRRAARASGLAAHGRAAAGGLASRRFAAAALAGVALLVHAGTALLAHPGTALLLACARTSLLLRAHAGARLGAGVLRLRELDAADRRIGRNGGGNGESCRGPQDYCECSHLFLLRRGLPGGQSPRKASVSGP